MPQLQSNIADLEKRIKQWEKQVEKIPLACPLKPGDKTPRQVLRWKIHQKKRRLTTLKAKLERLGMSCPHPRIQQRLPELSNAQIVVSNQKTSRLKRLVCIEEPHLSR